MSSKDVITGAIALDPPPPSQFSFEEKVFDIDLGVYITYLTAFVFMRITLTSKWTAQTRLLTYGVFLNT